MRNRINRAFSWLKKTLEITDVATVPQAIRENVRPVVDLFGWERLDEVEISSTNAAAPAVVAASGTPGPGILRLILSASISHSDTGVTHQCSLNKRTNPANFNVGIPTDREAVDVGEFCSMIGRTFLRENDFLIANVISAPAVGNLSLRFYFVDLEIGEYMQTV